MRKTVLEFVSNEYGVSPEYLFKDDLYTAVLRHPNGKWFGVIMRVKRDRLGIYGDGYVDIINVKNHPELISNLVLADEFLPAYHMNKEKWISVILDGRVEKGMLFSLIDDSFNIIGQKTKNKRK